MAKLDVQNDYIPKNYDDLYRYYILGDGRGNSLCHKLIRSMMPHATDDERETLSQDVFVRLMEKKMLTVFDVKKANFGGVIFFVTRSIVCNYLDRKGRTPLTGLRGGSLTATDPEDGEFEPGQYSLDRLFAPEIRDVGAEIDAGRMVKKLLEWARDLSSKPAHRRDASLFQLITLLAEGNDARECGEALGVTPSTVHNWLGVLRQKVTELQTQG